MSKTWEWADEKRQPCGTYAAAVRHIRHGGYAELRGCSECHEVHKARQNEYQRAYRARKRAQR